MWKKENSNLDETWWYVEKLGNFLYPLNTYLLNQTINFLLELSRSDKNIHDHLFIRILRLIHVELVNIKSWKIFVVGIIGIYESYEFHIIGFFFSLGWVHKYDLHVRFYLLGSPANTNITSFFAKFLSISMYQIPVYSLFLFLSRINPKELFKFQCDWKGELEVEQRNVKLGSMGDMWVVRMWTVRTEMESLVAGEW